MKNLLLAAVLVTLFTSVTAHAQMLAGDSSTAIARTTTTPRNTPSPFPNANSSISSAANNALYLQILGVGLLYSINYACKITSNIIASGGFMYLSLSGSTVYGSGGSALITKFTGIPLTLNYLMFGSAGSMPSSNIEIGLGVTPFFISATNSQTNASRSTSYFMPSGNLGYRFQPEDGGFLFRLDFDPLLLGNHFLAYGGISFGFAF